MKIKFKLNCFLYSNLIICIFTMNFIVNLNYKNLVLLDTKSENTLEIIQQNDDEKNNVVDDSSTNEEIETIVIKSKEVQSTSKINYIKPSYNSVTGANLVNYAKNYLGLRYVSAGNSLATGTDCSGFTSLIYREFGISLGRTVDSQIYSGAYVSKSDLEPGDLVFYGYSDYASHVAIYIGNQLIIHESNPRDGVKINSVNIMNYITARRLITSNVTSNIEQIIELEEEIVEDVIEETVVNNEFIKTDNIEEKEPVELLEEIPELNDEQILKEDEIVEEENEKINEATEEIEEIKECFEEIDVNEEIDEISIIDSLKEDVIEDESLNE